MLQKCPVLLDATAAFDNVSILKHRHPPLLIVHGADDWTIPVSHARELFSVASGAKSLVVIDGAGHTGDRKLMLSQHYFDAVRQLMQHVLRTSYASNFHNS